jgi:hypothetical protein
MATRLAGWAAIEFAERNSVTLSKHAEPGSAACDDLTPAEARLVAERNPDLIYIDFDEIPPAASGTAVA